MRSPRTSAARRRAVVLICAFVGVCSFVASPAAANRSQDPVTTTAFALDTTTPSSTTTPSTSADTTPSTTRRAAREADTSQIDSENRRFTMVIVGLLVVAALLALLTIRYWRVTKPGRKPKPGKRADAVDPDEFDDDDLFITSDDAGAGADDERDDDLDDDDAVDDQVVAPATASRSLWGRRSRRAVAGADHADADDDWEPMATGELEKVSGQVPRATSRPNAAQRARALGAPDPDA